MNLRFAATSFPEPTGQVTSDVEKLIQWFLEIAFVRDFVYRNPEKRKGKEFSDALILFHDTAIVLQIKTQTGTRDRGLWVANNLNDALNQLNGSVRTLKERRVPSFRNELLAIDVPFDPSTFKCIYGLVVLSIDGSAIDYEPLMEPANAPTVDTNVLSLNDLAHACRTMSTAADFIVYLELRHELATRKRLLINDEARTMEMLATELPGLMRFGRGVDPGKYSKSLQGFRRMLSGEILADPDYRFGLLVDDIIAHSHDTDPAFSDSADPLGTLKVAERLGYLTRQRRILLGKHMFLRALRAQDGSPRLFVHLQRALGQLLLFLYTDVDRRLRREWLRTLAEAACYRYSCTKVLAIGTEPIGAGRSYDLLLLEKQGPLGETKLPAEIEQLLPPLTVDLFEHSEDEDLRKVLAMAKGGSAEREGT